MGRNFVLYTAELNETMGRIHVSKTSDFCQLSRAFLWLYVFSNNNTTEVSGKVFLCCNTLAAGALPPLGELTALPRPLIGGKGAGCPLPKNLTPGVLYGELWSCISKLLDLIMVGW